MSDKLQKFTDLMQSIFELDKSDLDFGIYRIMNIRKAKIEKFLKEGLPTKVKETLEPFASNIEEIEARIAEIEKTCDAVGVEVADSKMADEYAALKAQLLAGVDISALETDVYSALYSFFNRYYDEGDFISKRRYKEGVYAIPYEGEEVKLHWANQDQYYIKTAENFKDYTFKDGESTVHFRLVDATTEQNNNKEGSNNKRVFMLYKENEEHPEIKTFEQNDNELIIRFVFDVPEDKKRKYHEENAQAISNAIIKNYRNFIGLLRNVSLDPKKSKTVIEKHLEAYVAKNTFDYFIHKDLRKFLNRELDFYIKSEVIRLDDLDTTNEKRVETYLAKVKAIKRVGRIIIDFLAKIEDFQKKLWLKKKFVIEVNWCITLDKIDERFYQEIIENKAQIKEWIDMYAINEIIDGLDNVGYSEPLTVDFLCQNQNLVVDTKHFTVDFKDRLIASINKIDDETNGLLIRSENYQALTLLNEKHKSKVQCVYIDPPYNTSNRDFLYKDNYKHSSWLSMMQDRYAALYSLLNDNSNVFTQIDYNEANNLLMLLKNIFGEENYVNEIIWRRKQATSYSKKQLGITNDTIFWFSKTSESVFNPIYTKDDEHTQEYIRQRFVYTEEETGRKFMKSPLVNSLYRPNLKYVFKGINPPPNGWLYSQERMEAMYDNNELVMPDSSDARIYRKIYEDTYPGQLIQNLWTDIPIVNPMAKERVEGFTTQKPSALISRLISLGSNDSDTILDYFAGSGTTAYSVLKLNNETGSNRKFILVEMGEFFDSILIARIKNAIREFGNSGLYKYLSLESYEDALSNIESSDKDEQMYALFGEDYLINYMLDIDAEGSLLNLDSFKTPFEYKLKIIEGNETKEKIIDLVETFNYLIGLSVVRQSAVDYFSAVANEQGTYEGAVRLIKDAGGGYAFKQIEGILPDGRRVLIIWRNITDNLIESNAALDAYFTEHNINSRNREFDVIYVNGDNNLENLRMYDENWKVRMIDIDFKKCMFEEV